MTEFASLEYVRVLALVGNKLFILLSIFAPLFGVVSRRHVGQPFQQLHVFILNPLEVPALVLNLPNLEVPRIDCAFVAD